VGYNDIPFSENAPPIMGPDYHFENLKSACLLGKNLKLKQCFASVQLSSRVKRSRSIEEGKHA
jgi:hypothetical protein